MSFVPAVARARLSQLATRLPLSDSSLLERNALQQALTDYKYPVLTLPSEVTSEIFLHFLPSYPKRAILHRTVLAVSPAANLPRMARRGVGDARIVEHLRGQDSCSSRRQTDDSKYPLIAALFDLLLQQTQRWQDMRLELPYQELQRIACSLPILRDLHLDVAKFDADKGVKSSQNLALHTPNLRKLVLYPGKYFNSFKSVFPWSQITVLDAHLYEHDAAHVLRSAGALEECSITLMDGTTLLSTIASPIPPLRHLKSLSLETYSGSPMADTLVKALAKALPALRTLTISEFLLGEEDPVGTLSSLCPPGYTGPITVSDACREADEYEQAFPHVKELVVEPWEDPNYCYMCGGVPHYSGFQNSIRVLIQCSTFVCVDLCMPGNAVQPRHSS
ncbi:hypothetical protein FB45DRAFT_1000016 [Roridomyces roridus]|uniref:Uncharacterized protein n=1 Tax=Roridomyces roridus TaxID=1738132 RepID=A0AAD7C7U0_9AGAR|nr:hypothetical protein FB45DRAFT_1000016 [Roridomyces roridus]